MVFKRLFKRPSNPLEGQPRDSGGQTEHDISDDVAITCPNCKKTTTAGELAENVNLCPYCRHHFRMTSRQRLSLITDPGTFVETDGDLLSSNILDFPQYDDKLTKAKVTSTENEAVVTGRGRIGDHPAAIFVMEPNFMMGSMGSVVGEKITRLFEQALAASLPVVGFTVSGGARMQEGIISLMQMAKVSGAVKRHSDAGLLFLCVLTDPTTGGVTASFAMQGDIIVAEPGALIGFAGPRVIEQTIRKKLPPGFQRSEFLLDKGFLDDIVDRRQQKSYIATVLDLHERRTADASCR